MAKQFLRRRILNTPPPLFLQFVILLIEVHPNKLEFPLHKDNLYQVLLNWLTVSGEEDF
jgi:hypothetical protein